MSALSSKPLLQAYRGVRTPTPPIWAMRQAGRYLPEYQKIRQSYSLLQCMTTPELATEITLQPIRRYALDGAIIFADILTPLIGMGANLDFVEGRGPVIANPIRTAADVQRIELPDDASHAKFTLDALRSVAQELEGTKVSLIGFAGAPFTLSSYFIEGQGGGSDPWRVRSFMRSEPKAWHDLQDKLVHMLVNYLAAQVEAGAEAVQLFDSSLGCLSIADYKEYVAPHLKRLIVEVKKRISVPVVFFAVGTGHLLQEIRELPFDVLSTDWRLPISEVVSRLDRNIPVQGNLDPTLLLAPEDVLRREVMRIVGEGKAALSHIFNLGHGVLQVTPPDSLQTVIDTIRQ